MAVATGATPQAIASRSEFDIPSEWDGWTNTSAACRYPAT
jgi:hypothetical protein